MCRALPSREPILSCARLGELREPQATWSGACLRLSRIAGESPPLVLRDEAV